MIDGSRNQAISVIGWGGSVARARGSIISYEPVPPLKKGDTLHNGLRGNHARNLHASISQTQRKAVKKSAQLVTNGEELGRAGKSCRSRLSGFKEINGRHEETRTPDLYRVNFVVSTLEPFSFLAFPHSASAKETQNSLVLVTSW